MKTLYIEKQTRPETKPVQKLNPFRNYTRSEIILVQKQPSPKKYSCSETTQRVIQNEIQQ